MSGPGVIEEEVAMAFPLVPFAAGFALGSLLTYGYKDKAIHDRILQGAQDFYTLVAGRVTAVKDSVTHLSQPRLRMAEELKSVKEGVAATLRKAEITTVSLAKKAEDAAGVVGS
jgi:hypothetical protein